MALSHLLIYIRHQIRSSLCYRASHFSLSRT